MISSLAMLLMSDQEVFFLHLVLHLPVLQKVSSLSTMRATQFKGFGLQDLGLLFSRVYNHLKLSIFVFG